METAKEVWKDVKSFEGYYQISNIGHVKSLRRKRFNKPGFVRERILKNQLSGQIKNKPYYLVNLYKESNRTPKRIHILMAESFLNHISDGHKELVVDHIDNDSLNNNLENLQLITARENTTKDRKSTSLYRGVHFKKERKKWISTIRYNDKRYFLGYFKIEKNASIAYEEALNKVNKGIAPR